MSKRALTTEEQVLWDLAKTMSRKWVNRSSALESGDLTQACWLAVGQVIRSWDPTKSSLTHWGRIAFRKAMDAQLRAVAVVRLSERRVVMAGRVGRYESELQSLIKKMAKCSDEGLFEALQNRAETVRKCLEHARVDALSLKTYERTDVDGRHMDPGDYLGRSDDTFDWEHDLQNKLLRSCLKRVSVNNRSKASREQKIAIMHGVSRGEVTRDIASKVGLSHAGVGKIAKQEFARLRKQLDGYIEQDVFSTDDSRSALLESVVK